MICEPCRAGGEMVAAAAAQSRIGSETGGVFNPFLIEGARRAHAECRAKKTKKGAPRDSKTQCDCQHKLPELVPVPAPKGARG